jgi:hypothetical protein
LHLAVPLQSVIAHFPQRLELIVVLGLGTGLGLAGLGLEFVDVGVPLVQLSLELLKIFVSAAHVCPPLVIDCVPTSRRFAMSAAAPSAFLTMYETQPAFDGQSTFFRLHFYPSVHPERMTRAKTQRSQSYNPLS